MLRLNTRKQSTDKGNIVGVQVKQSTFSWICGDRSLRSSSLRKMGTQNGHGDELYKKIRKTKLNFN